MSSSTVKKRIVCNKCNVRLPANRPKLKCSNCNEVKHFRCENLTKNDALRIIHLNNTCSFNWACSKCTLDLLQELPIGACQTQNNPNSTKPKFSIKCHACKRRSYSERNVLSCSWCENLCHKKCVKGSLGCIKCCEDLIPGYHCTIYDLADGIPRNNFVFNPYCHSDLVNQIGDQLDVEEGDNFWSDIANFLAKCKYKQLKELGECNSNEANIFALNIRSLQKNVSAISENIQEYQNFDFLCFNETN